MSIVTTKKLYHLSGLSTETKPIPDDISTGSTYLELDTGLNFVFNRTAATWIQVKSQDIPTPVADVPCMGIKSVSKTSSTGLIDTYTIEYTNGAQTTFEITNSVTINPDIPNTLIDGKAYAISAKENKSYSVSKILSLDGRINADDKLVSEKIANTAYWEHDETSEGKFVLVLEDCSIIFTLVNSDQNHVATWQGFIVSEDDEFTRYVGHFVSDTTSETYHFEAVEQTLDFTSLETQINDVKTTLAATITAEKNRATTVENNLSSSIIAEIARAKAVETSITTDLTTEVNRATVAEASLSEAITEAITTEKTRAEAAEASITTEVNKKVDKVKDKGLSTNDYTNAEKTKLADIATSATKVETSDTNGNIKINGEEITVYTLPDTAVLDADYSHITVSATDGVSTTKGTITTTYKYNDESLKTRLTDLEATINGATGETPTTGLTTRVTTLEGVTVSASTTNGYINIGTTPTKVYELPTDVVEDSNYAHISVTTDSVTATKGTITTTYKYDDTELSDRVTEAETGISTLKTIVGSDNSGLVQAVSVNTNSITTLSATVNTINTALNSKIGSITINDGTVTVSGGTAAITIPTYTITSAALEEGSTLAYQYKFEKDGNTAMTINIPKAAGITKGEVVINTEGIKCLELEIGGSTVDIPLTDLVQPYSAGNGISINSSNTIAVELAENSGLTVTTGNKIAVNLAENSGLTSTSVGLAVDTNQIQPKINETNQLDATFITTTNDHQFVSADEKTTWNNKIADVKVNDNSVVTDNVANISVPTYSLATVTVSTGESNVYAKYALYASIADTTPTQVGSTIIIPKAAGITRGTIVTKDGTKYLELEVGASTVDIALTDLVQTYSGDNSTIEIDENNKIKVIPNVFASKNNFDTLVGVVGSTTSGLVKDVADLKAVGATKVETSNTNGNIKINGEEITVYTEVANTVHDENYAHISVTTDSVSDGTNTFNAYDDTELSDRVTAVETTVGGSTSGLVKDVSDLQSRFITATVEEVALEEV